VEISGPLRVTSLGFKGSKGDAARLSSAQVAESCLHLLLLQNVGTTMHFFFRLRL
jgi:hypothetical protein